MIRAVLFDLDGTLWENPVRWDELRRELGLPPDGPPDLLAHLALA
jgi:phosphoglycolate phosphatase-like HAD superfamily hydrolase